MQLMLSAVCLVSLGVRVANAQTTTTTTTTTTTAPAPPPAPVVVLAPTPQPVAPPIVQQQYDPDAHVHHGVWARAQVGPAGFTMSTKVGSDSFDLSGGGAGISLAAGFAVSPNLVLYGELFDDVAVGPTLKMNGQDLGTAGGDVSAGVVGFGPGVQFYTSSNFFVGGTATLFRLVVQQNGNDVGRSDLGYGISARAGKEWWVSDSWGIGLAAQVFVGSVPVSDQDAAWTAAGVMLALSASYH